MTTTVTPGNLFTSRSSPSGPVIVRVRVANEAVRQPSDRDPGLVCDFGNLLSQEVVANEDVGLIEACERAQAARSREPRVDLEDIDFAVHISQLDIERSLRLEGERQGLAHVLNFGRPLDDTLRDAG